MVYTSALQLNEQKKWMKLKNFMLSDRKQTQNTLYSSIYMKFEIRQTIYSDREQISVSLCCLVKGVVTVEGQEGPFEEMKRFCVLVMVMFS